MGMRIDEEFVKARFVRLCDVMNKRVAKTYHDVGSWKLEVNKNNNKKLYRIVEITSLTGGEKYPINDLYMNGAEFSNICAAIINALKIYNCNK